jgi:DNA primase large subunit
MEVTYDEVIESAEQRYLFHERLAYESKHRLLDYRDVRTLGIKFGVPLRRLSTNSDQLHQDHISFYCLLMVSLRSEDAARNFARHEERLFLYRLRASEISIVQIKDYFWTDVSLKDSLIASHHSTDSDSFFRLDFEAAFDFLVPENLDISDGSARLSLDDVYQIVARMYNAKLLVHIEKYRDSLLMRRAVISALGDTFAQRVQPKRVPLISLESLDRLSGRSFPPCMFRILSVLKKSRTLTFKAQFELSLFLKDLGLDFYALSDFWRDYPCQLNLASVFGMDDLGKDYSPHSCVTMVLRESPKNVYQVQGCPFRYMAPSELKMYLRKMGRGVRAADVEAIGMKVPEHPQIACRMFFDARFPEEPFTNAGIGNPGQFFIESERRIKKILLER